MGLCASILFKRTVTRQMAGRFYFELVRDYDEPRSLVINAVSRGPSSSVSAVNFNPSPRLGHDSKSRRSETGSVWILEWQSFFKVVLDK